ncbi:N-acetylglucosamine-binding protein GbpA [Pantoea sp. 1.19]|uniref:N-acetylglucosamine-binding protein GbpA n=1 Tax=Pantoea sp. 1.19 TaxID=1925589 RepID=UPI0009F963EE|nr:N-acetylglucosamine-binding protein GbpA [Pantoea sp. 1.19]
MKLSKLALAISALAFSGGVLAHGYISEPASRDQMCRMKDGNTQCGQALYEPQSAGEGPDRFPETGPRDGHLVSGDGASEWIGANLNAQTSDRWVKHRVSAGKRDFTWTFTASHPIRDFRYFMTKEGWDPNKPLSRAAFTADNQDGPEPFCTIPGGPAIPGSTTHSCTLPERSGGYHVIYAAWDVSDTTNTFYKVIDVIYDDVASEWKNSIGSIQPSRALEAGDSVKARLFDAHGEREPLSVTLNIDSAEAGEPNSWALALAKKINAAHDTIRAGVMNKEGEVVPTAGTNTIYSKAGSEIVRVEIQVNAQADSRPSLTLVTPPTRHVITEGENHIDFSAKVTGEMALNAKVYNAKQENVGFGSAKLENSTDTVTLKLWQAEAGPHTVVVDGNTPDGQHFQQSFDLALINNTAGDYDFVFPDGMANYTDGTKVLQPKTQQVYECKPFPYSGWCKQNAHPYEPGVGSNWQDAWSLSGATKKHAH